MATPQAVQRQLEQAEALQAQIVAANQQVEVVSDASQLVQTPTPQPPAQAPAPVTAPPAETVDWKARYQSLQGMYNSDVPKLHAQAKVFESQVATLSEQVRALTAATAQKQNEPPKPAVDPRDVEQFGESMMEMVQRYLNGVMTNVNGALGAIDNRVKALEGQVQGVSKRTEDSLEAQFWTTLANLVPDYEAVNASEGWLAWLSGVDRLTGRPRQELLSFAQKSMDAKRVAEFFETYKSSIPPAPSAALSSQVSPSSGGAAEVPLALKPQQVITQSFIDKFYRDQIRGVYKGREAESAQIEAAINQAAAEGRIR